MQSIWCLLLVLGLLDVAGAAHDAGFDGTSSSSSSSGGGSRNSRPSVGGVTLLSVAAAAVAAKGCRSGGGGGSRKPVVADHCRHDGPALSLSAATVRRKRRAAAESKANISQNVSCRGGGITRQRRRPADTAGIKGPAAAVAETTRLSLPSSGEALLMHRLRTGLYFGLWYALNVIFNILNKQVLNVLPQPIIVGTIQLGVGSLYVLGLWALQLRTRPTLQPAGRVAVAHVGFWHGLGQLASMVSLGAGPVSFTHIVKALEPLFSALISVLVYRHVMPVPVYAALLPVVGGVGVACLKEHYFSWLSFWFAMLSNLAFALRAVLSKVAMSSKTTIGTNLSPPNVFGLVTIAAFVVSIPMAVLAEGSTWQRAWKDALLQQSQYDLIKAIFVSGMFHYLNNEVMYLALGNVHPVTLAVCNTMKRVFIMVASVMVFRNPISLQAGVGSAVGIFGVLLYSLTRQHYEKLDAAARTKKQR